MTDYPLLPLPLSERGEPPGRQSFAQRGPKLSPQRQGQRLGPGFERLRTVLASDESGLSLRADPSGIAPERALVFEVAGSIGDFHRLVRKIHWYEGERAVSFVDDGHVSLRIFCREQAGALDRPIRYGAAVTIEAGEGVRVYDEIRARLGVPVTPPGL